MKRFIALLLSVIGLLTAGIVAYQHGAFNDMDFVLYYAIIMALDRKSVV